MTPFQRRYDVVRHKMVEHTKAIRGQYPMNCFIVSDHFVSYDVVSTLKRRGVSTGLWYKVATDHKKINESDCNLLKVSNSDYSRWQVTTSECKPPQVAPTN